MLTITPLKYELPHSTGYASPQFHPRFSILEADKPYLCNNLLFSVSVLLPTFYDGEGFFRFSEETPISLHVRNLNHKLLMWKLSARNSPINPAAIRHTRLIVYKLLFILGMPDFSSIPSTTLFFLDGEQRISNFRTWESNPVLSFPSVPNSVGPVQYHFLTRPTQS